MRTILSSLRVEPRVGQIGVLCHQRTDGTDAHTNSSSSIGSAFLLLCERETRPHLVYAGGLGVSRRDTQRKGSNCSSSWQCPPWRPSMFRHHSLVLFLHTSCNQSSATFQVLKSASGDMRLQKKLPTTVTARVHVCNFVSV